MKFQLLWRCWKGPPISSFSLEDLRPIQTAQVFSEDVRYICVYQTYFVILSQYELHMSVFFHTTLLKMTEQITVVQWYFEKN